MKLTARSHVTILLPVKATSREQFAAEELKKYLKLLLRCEVALASDEARPDGPAFLIGGPERNAQSVRYLTAEEFRTTVPGPEGMLIRALDADTVLLAGSSWHVGECERGTIYAVYEFLERYCGCVLAAYSHPHADAGEIVPHMDALELDGAEYCKPSADRPYRTAIVQYEDAAGNPKRDLNIPFFDWLVKNRYNRFLTWTSVYEYFKKSGLLPEFERRGIRFTVGHHESSRLFLPAHGNEYFPEHYYETHPEYFKLQSDGTRFHNTDHWGQWIYCTRNESMIREVAKNIIEWVAENPAVDVLALWPNDGMAEQCTCPACAKYSKVENYCYFINSVAKLVNKVHPHLRFDMLIYVDLWDCPEGLSLEPSILVDEATWHNSGLRTTGKKDGSSLSGTHFEENLLKWKKTGAKVVYYDYYMGIYGVRQRWLPMADEVQAIWKNFIDKGISGAGTQIETFNLWNHLLNFYTFGRTGYDTSLTVEDTVTAVASLCGKAAPVVKEILLTGEALVDGQLPLHKCATLLMENIDKQAIYAAYERAFSLADTPRARNNLRLLRMVFRYSDLEVQEEASRDKKYDRIKENYVDARGEMGFMTRFDSFWKNNPGYGIAFPLKSEEKNFVPDKWYLFE
ncbi:MAG: DUF4838 domain-containing protein [Ruminococcaceae bacterium]|nr:DUF4838 domain-containing protein [Oscillospiraceae bacterium]